MKIGFRAWAIEFLPTNPPALKSLVTDTIWSGPIFESGKPARPDVYDKLMQNFSITQNPHIGIHSYSKFDYLNELLDEEGEFCQVNGIIHPFGTTEIYEKGYRSEKAQVLGICGDLWCDMLDPDKAPCTKIATIFWHSNRPRPWTYLKMCDNHRYEGFTPYATTESVIRSLAERYGCDILSTNQLENAEKYYGFR
jgi:hypothetical protein